MNRSGCSDLGLDMIKKIQNNDIENILPQQFVYFVWLFSDYYFLYYLFMLVKTLKTKLSEKETPLFG